MVSTLSFLLRIRLRRGRFDGVPSNRTRRFLYLNQIIRFGDDVQVGPENVLGSIEDVSVG